MLQTTTANVLTIWEAGVKAVQPHQVLPSWLHTQHFETPPWVLSVGKAACAMAHAVQSCIPIAGRLIVTKHGHTPTNFHQTSVDIILEAGHPIPDEASVQAAQATHAFIAARQENEVVLVLLSGGASSLLADLPESVALSDLQTVSQLLVNCGASIHEINTVRKHCATLKGGQLAQHLFPTKVVTVSISDVLGDDASVIGSGLTVPDASTFEDAISILQRYHLWEACPPTIQTHLCLGVEGKHSETLKQSLMGHTYQCLANNQRALLAAKAQAETLGYEVEIVSTSLCGDIQIVAETIGKRIKQAHQAKQNGHTTSTYCLLWGGEPTVRLPKAHGLGGRNQQLALLVAQQLQQVAGRWIFLSAGSDGTDGPTDAAGGWVTDQTGQLAEAKGLNLSNALETYNSYQTLKTMSCLFQPGPTQTNVMDLMVALI